LGVTYRNQSADSGTQGVALVVGSQTLMGIKRALLHIQHIAEQDSWVRFTLVIEVKGL
jgi:hypothetical protein